MTNTHLLIIDPQNDFCHADGSLYVPGAEKDMQRLANFIESNVDQISRITVTLDMHKTYHIASPIFWVNDQGEHPPLFTIITLEDINSNLWRASDHNAHEWARQYVQSLEITGRYSLCIWPYHCIIGSWGCNIYNRLLQALSLFEKTFKPVNYIFKGSCSYTEHYSALLADVQVKHDDSTKFNSNFFESINKSDKVLVGGEALSHCVANTVLDIGAYSGNLSKFTLIKDTTSNVAGFEALGDSFISLSSNMGMQICNAKEVFSNV